jgi:dihydropteroate synthase
MGVLNLTPDSFSDGGQFNGAGCAPDFAESLVAAGADWIDIGGESTRPGSHPISEAEQIRRTIPLLSAIRGRVSTLISIDTTRGEVARAALDNGANVVNDISAGQDDPDMLALCARRGVPIVLMHMQGTPATMQLNPSYGDVTAEVSDFLCRRRDAAIAARIQHHRILLDPGLGFGKTLSHNLQLVRDTARLSALGQPLVFGPSRKGFIGQVLDEPDPRKRLFGTAAIAAWCAANGAAVLRVHDVGPIAQTLRMIAAIAGSTTGVRAAEASKSNIFAAKNKDFLME